MCSAKLRQQFVDVGDATLEVFTGGSGDITVCYTLNGVAFTDEGSDVTRALQNDCQVMIVNARGMGNSSPGVYKRPYRDLAADLERVRERLGIERWVVSGYANGGGVALYYAEDHPERVAGLIVGFISATKRDGDENSSLSPLHRSNRELLSQIELPPVQPNEISRWMQLTDGRWLMIASGKPYIVWPYDMTEQVVNMWEEIWLMPHAPWQLSKVSAPTLVVAGEQDSLIPVHDCQEIADGIRGAEFLLLPNTGHEGIVPKDKDQHDRALQDFVKHRVRANG